MVELTDEPWARFAAATPLRRYQQRAVDELLVAIATPGSRACLVAPPGAGKTRCALHVAAALGRTVEVRVPTRTLVEQWRRRIANTIVDVLGDDAPPFEVTTYAAKRPPASGALVILDEAHHLVAAWGRRLAASLDSNSLVLGLTATPPFDSRGFDTFASLVGDAPITIDAPPLVRERHLAPYLDLVWPIVVDAEDAPALDAADRALAAHERLLGERLDAFIRRQLEEHWWQMTEARFAGKESLLVALCRMHRARGGALPIDLPDDPELGERPSLRDRADVLFALDPDDEETHAALGASGFRVTRGRIVAARDVASTSLAASRPRVRALLDILEHEARIRARELRALILTDRDVESDRISAREILKALVDDERTDPLDPILVTGRAFWVDDDLWPRIRDSAPELPWHEADGHHELDVSGWTVGDRVGLATQLLARGVTRCLVGTRHLLGEGWDCPPVNCVVDLTGIVSSVTVNQVRGRAMRSDPNDPAKVASLWEVLPLAPGLPDGDRLLVRLRERHQHTFGIDDAERIRAGVARIDPRLARPVADVAASAAAIRERMKQRVEHFDAAARAWAVGKAYLDRHVWRVSLDPVVRSTAARSSTSALAPVRRALATRPASRWVSVGLFGLAALALATTSIAGLAVAGLFALTGALALRPDPRRRMLEALHAALAQEGVSGDLAWAGESAGVDGEPEDSRRFAEAARELLGPIDNPRYLLAARGRLYAVPAELGRNRHVAERFEAEWRARVGRCELVYTRRGRGRELLRSAWRQPRRPVEVVELWE